MTIQQLKYFIEIANTRSLSRAARNLFVTQPTLSLALKKMEDTFGTSLFTHTDQAYQLTRAGLYLYEHGQLVVEQYDQLLIDLLKMNEAEKEAKTVIKFGITTLFSVQFMKEIAFYLETHPHIELEIIQGGSKVLQKAITDNEIDVGLLSFPNLYPETLCLNALSTSTKGYNVYVVIPENNPLSQKNNLTFKELEDQRFSSLSTNFMLGKLLIERGNACGYSPNIVLQNDDLQVLLHSVKSNESICILPIEYREFSNCHNVKWIPLIDQYNYFPIGIALKKDQQISADIQDLIEIINNN